MPSNLISGEFCVRGHIASHPSPQHGSCEHLASTSQVRLLVAEIGRQANEGSARESVARSIKRQVVVAAGNLASFKEALRKRLQDIDTASHSIKNVLALPMMKAQTSSQTPVDHMAQQPCNQGF